MTKTMLDTPTAPLVALIAYEGAQMSAVFGLADIFHVANRFARELGGIEIRHQVLHPPSLFDETEFEAVVLPPNLSGARGRNDNALHGWIAARHAAGATLCSACAGAFWLGYAGLLDGRPVTTHWAIEEEFRDAFPAAQLQPEHLLIDDHDLVTAGGVMAWVDLGLALVRRWQGQDVVARTCRQMLIDPHGREQSNYRMFRPKLDHGDDAIRVLQFWIEGHAAEDLSLSVLAERAAMSARSLQRRFTEATRLPISQYVQELRIEKARGLLERTSMTISEVCWAVGYTDTAAFSRLFKSICGTTAGEYRRRFSVK